MEKTPLYFFEKKTGEVEFVPKLESESLCGRLINQKYHKPGVRILRNLVSSISSLLITNNSSVNEDDESIRGNFVLEGCKDFLKMTPRNRNKIEHLQLFYWYGMPDYLVYLYESPIGNNKDIAEESIRLFLLPNIGSFPVHIQHLLCTVVLRFCDLLCDHTTTTSGRLLYYSCRRTIGSLLKSLPPANTNVDRGFSPIPAMVIRRLYRFTSELTKQLLLNMKLIRQSCFCQVPFEIKSRFESDIREFSIFRLHMCPKIEDHMMRLQDPSIDSLSLSAVMLDYVRHEWYTSKDPELFYDDFNELLNNIDLGLTYMDDGIEYTRCTECEFNHGWSYYLPILKELDIMSKLYHTAEKNLASCLISHRDSINKLIMKSKRGDEHQWLLRHKNLISKESRGHLIKMMFPNEVKNGCDLQKMNSIIIDRSSVLVDSFEHVGLANPILLRNGIIPRLKNDEAFEDGPGVFREWLLLLCQHLFAPQNSLFLSCPYDHQRFYPSPAKLDSQQLQYYGFCGRVIALALMHDVQIGIGFDRLFFLQLGRGSMLTLEDIRNADPYMYKSCRDILEMDTKLINSDCLGLTFVWETEEKDECGSRKIVELCPGGNTMVVSSMNREEYIKLVIEHCFIKSIEEKVKLFIQGIDDVLTRKCRKMFFESIELEDLDNMLMEKTIYEEDRNCNEVVGDSTITPFQKIIRTTLPLSSRRSFHLPLTCKQQSGGFRIY